MPTPTYDLFISYSSHDRPWAEKLDADLRASFPQLKIFWDRASIPAGVDYREFLKDAVVNTKHLLVLWSQAAKDSIEVEPEVSGFEAEVRRTPTLGGSKRQEFYVPLKCARGGGISDIQGFPDLATFYNPTAADRGISNLASGPGLKEWKRMIKMIGDRILNVDAAKAVIAAIVATNTKMVLLLDQIHGLRQNAKGPTLDEFLQGFGLQWADVRGRYGQNAREWHPFGGEETIVELLDDLRVQANSRLERPYWFRWEYRDLIDAVEANTVNDLVERPSVVFVDPISLYDSVCANAFRELKRYVRQEQSVIVSLSPIGQTGVDWIARVMRAQSVPILDDYFEQEIPPTIVEFAKCAFNVQRISDIERLVRSRIAWLELAARKAEAKHTTGTT